MTMPGWIVNVLAGNIARLQAEEIQVAAVVSMLPHISDNDRRRFLYQIESEATRGNPMPQRETIQLIEQNPDKAREWFEGDGIHVEKGK
jgi:hypothetical protein